MKQSFHRIKNKIESLLQLFFLKPASPLPLVALRISVATLLIIQAFFLRNSMLDFFSSDGMIQGELIRYFTTPYSLRISSLVDLAQKLGISSFATEAKVIYVVCSLYVMSLFLLALGLKTRVSAFVAWLMHWILANSSGAISYGIDLYAHVFLFYLMWAPSGDLLSLDSLLFKSARYQSTDARLSLRVMQLHLCVAYLFSGIEKAQGVQWWNGELLWRAISLPEYHQFDMDWLAYWPRVSQVAGWGTLLLEIGYCVFIWPRLTRRLWVAGIMGLHLGIIFFLGLGLFGAMMCFLTFCVFGISAEPAVVNEWINKWTQRIRTKAAGVPLRSKNY